MATGSQALAGYLARKKLSVADFAELVGAHRSQIYRALRDDRRPGRDLAAEIERVTDGAIPVSAWRDDPASAPRARETRGRAGVTRRATA